MASSDSDPTDSTDPTDRVDSTDRAELVEQRGELTRARDRALRNLLTTREYVEEGRRAPSDAGAAFGVAEAACSAVGAFDTAHPGVRTPSDAEEDERALAVLARIWG